MRHFRVKVEDQIFEVEVEEVQGEDAGTGKPVNTANAAPPASPHITAASPTAPVRPVVAPLKPAVLGMSGSGINAPMPGSIVKIPVNEGEQVKAKQLLMILEAMKMENEIIAPKDGVIRKIHVSVGQSVNMGDPLITFETT